MRFIPFLLLTFYTFAASGQISSRDSTSSVSAAIRSVKAHYFQENASFLVLDKRGPSLYQDLLPMNLNQLDGDSIDLVLIHYPEDVEGSAFVFALLIEPQAKPKEKEPLNLGGFNAFLRMVEFRVDPLGNIVFESETDFEP